MTLNENGEKQLLEEAKVTIKGQAASVVPLSLENDIDAERRLSQDLSRVVQLMGKWTTIEAQKYVSELIRMTELKNLSKTGFVPGFPLVPYGIYEVEMSPGVGSEQQLARPAILWSGLPKARTAVFIPLTKERWQDRFDFHVDLPLTFPNEESTALIDHLKTFDKVRIKQPFSRGGSIITIHLDEREIIKRELMKFLKLQ